VVSVPDMRLWPHCGVANRVVPAQSLFKGSAKPTKALEPVAKTSKSASEVCRAVGFVLLESCCRKAFATAFNVAIGIGTVKERFDRCSCCPTLNQRWKKLSDRPAFTRPPNR